jgi:hypothetical protein
MSELLLPSTPPSSSTGSRCGTRGGRCGQSEYELKLRQHEIETYRNATDTSALSAASLKTLTRFINKKDNRFQTEIYAGNVYVGTLYDGGENGNRPINGVNFGGVGLSIDEPKNFKTPGIAKTEYILDIEHFDTDNDNLVDKGNGDKLSVRLLVADSGSGHKSINVTNPEDINKLLNVIDKSLPGKVNYKTE